MLVLVKMMNRMLVLADGADGAHSVVGLYEVLMLHMVVTMVMRMKMMMIGRMIVIMTMRMMMGVTSAVRLDTRKACDTCVSANA